MDCGIELGTIFGWLFVSNSELLLATAVVTRRTGISIACIHFSCSLQCFDAVGWAARRASGL